jgi:hypothetical protein
MKGMNIVVTIIICRDRYLISSYLVLIKHSIQEQTSAIIFFTVWGAHILRIDFTSNDNIEYFIMIDWAKCGNGSSLAAKFLNPIFLCEFANTTKVSEYLCMSLVK